MISIKGLKNNGVCAIHKLFENEESTKAMEYYKELAAQGYTVEYTSKPEMTIEQYSKNLDERVKKILGNSGS
jgi:putative ribosome biogenesis GTPase RsgA